MKTTIKKTDSTRSQPRRFSWSAKSISRTQRSDDKLPIPGGSAEVCACSIMPRRGSRQ
jgi:hypothetical protein